MENNKQMTEENTTVPTNEEVIEELTSSCKSLNVSKESASGDASPVNEEFFDASEADEPVLKTDCEEEDDDDDDVIDEVALKDAEVNYTEEDLQKKKCEANEYKERGNQCFKGNDYVEAAKHYTLALRICPLAFPEDRAVLYANRGMCKMKRELNEAAIEDSSKAIELNPQYVKALTRRAHLYEKTEKLDEALADYKSLLEINPSNSEAKDACRRLPGQIFERNEKLKEDVLGSLKELGNKILKPFGLSTNNFQVNQDPNSGGYSINFKQNT